MALVQVQRTSPSPSIDEDSSELEYDDVLSVDGRGSTTSPSAVGSGWSRVRTLSECYFTVRGAAVILAPQADSPTCSRGGGEIELHLQAMMNLLRVHDKMLMTVRLQTTVPGHARYLSVVHASDAVVLLGVDCLDGNTTLGVVVPLSRSSRVELDGDGGVAVSDPTATHIFRPISVQAMWNVFQRLHNELARQRPYQLLVSDGPVLGFYRQRVNSPDILCSQWHQSPLASEWMNELRAEIPSESGGDVTLRREIQTQLRQIMQSVDLDTVTSRDIREQLDVVMQGRADSEREFVDHEMLVILGQMDQPSRVFPYLLLGTEWNASNYQELQLNKVKFILNVTREVDNFFPLHFGYMKVRVSDEESTQLLSHWNDTCNFIKQAKEQGQVVLVHCKKGISRSSSTVIAYAMKEYGMSLEQAVTFVRDKRQCITPNAGFVEQLKTWDGLLVAGRNRHSAVFNAPQTSGEFAAPHPRKRDTSLQPPRRRRSPSGSVRELVTAYETALPSLCAHSANISKRNSATTIQQLS